MFADDPAATIIFARNEIHDVNSPRTQSLGKEAIENCIRNHPGCPRLAANNLLLPTRVIDCRDPAYPRLVGTNGRHELYIALSYVWGEPQPHSTTTDNPASYLNSIDAQSLPKTIRDGACIRHAIPLGRHIVHHTKFRRGQDSRAASAHFTIVAGSAPKVSKGFLQSRSPPSRGDPSFKISCPPRAKVLGTLTLGRDINYYRVSTDTDPVHSLGWCLQEMFLSRRTLVYASQTLQYHCQTEVINIGRSVYQSDRFSDTPKYWTYRISLSMTGRRHWLRGRCSWNPRERGMRLACLKAGRRSSESITRRSITVSTDKFHAISAIAERFHQFRKSRYLAGLWEDTLLLDLLWTTVTDVASNHPMEYRAHSLPGQRSIMKSKCTRCCISGMYSFAVV
ncbi:hypothetical protein BDN71DRAFT_1547975 [Pleurotus eryngii]|uniref:Heterokaryon incompatibility domain-containing protein n=1 Tax=Pleurotus eryngii TaxID=5323 RepID=A0A9P6D060_PLEER|nr:hypothetical protein BDN71DRAFT_1547975 [Pleurotus eryngii]